MNLDAILTFLESSPTTRLLKADLGPFVIFFLRRAFKSDSDDSAISFSHDELASRLQVFQDELRDEERPEMLGSADRYLREWSDAGWLRRFLPADSTGPHYQLTRYSEDAIRIVDAALNRDSRLVGTESRLRLVIDTLVDLVRNASPDPDRRLTDLLQRRQQIDNEIASIRSGGEVETYHPAQIRERFFTAVDLLKTLQSDFRAVEDRFEAIGRQVQREAIKDDRRRGAILASALDAEDLIKQQDEGVSFDAFVAFLFAPQAQAKLRETIAEVTHLDALTGQRAAVQHIRAMVPSLLAEADNVLRQTGRLSQTLRRLLDESLKAKRGDSARLEHEIAHSGGARLQRLPDLIAAEEQQEKSKREKRLSFEAKLQQTGIQITISSAQQLEKAHQTISSTRDALVQRRQESTDRLSRCDYELGVLRKQLDEDARELDSLRRRKGNLPDAFIEVRAAICNAFKLPPTELPFVAELVAVDPDHGRWEASIEQVLHSFARTLLVPDDLYAQVSGYVDATRLTDSHGRGLRLTYDRVAPTAAPAGPLSDDLSLPEMLHYRDDHPLASYVRGEILHRFDHLACETIADFQMANRRAMTIHRHVKQNHRQHARMTAIARTTADTSSSAGTTALNVRPWKDRSVINRHRLSAWNPRSLRSAESAIRRPHN